MSQPAKCQNCHKQQDFENKCYGSCFRCKKDYLCEECTYDHECVVEGAINVRIIRNPTWLCDLIKKIREEE